MKIVSKCKEEKCISTSFIFILYFIFFIETYMHTFLLRHLIRALLFSPFLEYCGHMSCEIVYASSTHALYN